MTTHKTPKEAWYEVFDLCSKLGASEQPTGILTVTRFIQDLYDDAMKYKWLMGFIETIAQEGPDSLIPRDDNGRINPKGFLDQLNRIMGSDPSEEG